MSTTRETTPVEISDDVRARRARTVDDALHSTRMEGLDVDEQTLADSQEYVDGQLSADELVHRARVRSGLS